MGEGGGLEWPGESHIRPDALSLRLTGKAVEWLERAVLAVSCGR